jgi:TIR domain
MNGQSEFVFVSYANVNRDRVVAIVDAIEAAGIRTWFDRDDIPGGTSYGTEFQPASGTHPGSS